MLVTSNQDKCYLVPGKRVLFRKHDGRRVRAQRVSDSLIFTLRKHNAQIKHTAVVDKGEQRTHTWEKKRWLLSCALKQFKGSEGQSLITTSMFNKKMQCTGATWLTPLSLHPSPGLTQLVWLSRLVSPPSLTAPCTTLPKLFERTTLSNRWKPVFGQGWYTRSCATLLEPPNKLSRYYALVGMGRNYKAGNEGDYDQGTLYIWMTLSNKWKQL